MRMKILHSSKFLQVSIAVFTTLLHLPQAMSSGYQRLSDILLIISALLHLPLASCLSQASLSTSLVFTTTLLHLPGMSSGHPCLSEAGLTSAICSRLIQHCSSPLGSKTAACQVSQKNLKNDSSLMLNMAIITATWVNVTSIFTLFCLSISYHHSKIV